MNKDDQNALIGIIGAVLCLALLVFGYQSEILELALLSGAVLIVAFAYVVTNRRFKRKF